METKLKLNAEEQTVLDSVYGRQIDDLNGYNPNQLEAVMDLTEQEWKFFAGKNFVSPHFFIQTLYKVSGTISPIKFKIAVNQLLKDNKSLRVNFCNVGTRTVKVIRSDIAGNAEVIFRNVMQVDADDLDDEFRKIMEADMRRDFDIRHDALIRFAVYKTGDREFAVLVTLAQLIADNFDAEKFFCNALGVPDEYVPKNSPDKLPPPNQAAILEHWAKVLDKAPPPAVLPYERQTVAAYHQRAHRMTIPADILSDLRGRAQSNRMMLTAILQSAWGFMLHLANKRRDCLFCQILSDENSSLNIIPVRVTGDDNLTVEQIVGKQFRQLVVSQPYSCIDWSTPENFSRHGRKLFDHFLSFKEFQSNELNYIQTPATSHGEIVARNSWDARGMKLGAYFHYSEKKLSINFLCDSTKFFANGVENLCKLYEVVLQQMLNDWNAKFADFFKRLNIRAEIPTDITTSFKEDNRKKIRDFLSQLPILQGRFGGTIGLFDGQAELITRYEGDRISGELLKKKFVFVVDGKLARNVDSGDGWYNPIDIVAKNSFVNPTNFLERQRLTLSAEVLTERAELLTIPRNVMIDVLRKNSEVALSMMNFALEQMERWQILWLQS